MNKIVTALLLSAAVSVPAFAANEGGYVAVDLGSVSYSGSNNSSAYSNVTFPNPSAITLGGGYRFSPYLSVEGGYSIIGNSVINTTGAVTASETLKTSSLHVAAVGTYSINDMFEVFGKLGLANTKIDYTATETAPAAFTATANASKTNLMFGLGGQYNINKHFGLRLQYQDFGKVTFSASNGDIGVKATSVGGIYSF